MKAHHKHNRIHLNNSKYSIIIRMTSGIEREITIKTRMKSRVCRTKYSEFCCITFQNVHRLSLTPTAFSAISGKIYCVNIDVIMENLFFLFRMKSFLLQFFFMKKASFQPLFAKKDTTLLFHTLLFDSQKNVNIYLCCAMECKSHQVYHEKYVVYKNAFAEWAQCQ